MPDVLTNPEVLKRPGLKTRPRRGMIGLREMAWFTVFALLGVGGALYPEAVLALLGVGALAGLVWLAVKYIRRAGLEIWQVLALISLSGYLVLNYGFENLSIHAGGFPIIISYMMMYTALFLAFAPRPQMLGMAWQEPCVIFALILLAMTFVHLTVELPAYGVWALRDASMCMDALFLLLGMLWATKPDSLTFLTKWLLLLFIINMFYGFTLPWGETLFAWSPRSGVFLNVPLFGNYNGTGDILLMGAVFCVCVGTFVIKRWQWILFALAMGQFLGIAITQVRRMYLGTVIVIILLMLLGEGKKFAKLFFVVPVGILILWLVTSVGGLEITGRIGPVSMDFFKDHIRSIGGAEDTPGSPVDSRFAMADEAMEHFYKHPIVGEGFGKPLLTEVADDTNGAQVTRMPHDSSLTYLARLGSIGLFFWICFHVSWWIKFVGVFRHRRGADPRTYAFIIWFFLYYVLFMIDSFVEPPFEYPSHAIPFYFLMGFTLGLIRWQLSPKKKGERQLVPVSGAASGVPF